MNALKTALIIALGLVTSEAFADYDTLTRKNYEESTDEKAVILYGVNWGRKWGCAGFDNAQLHNLTFSRIDSSSGNLGGEDIVLNNPAKLLARNVSESYAIIVDPGEYALTGFDVKVAKSQGRFRFLTQRL